MKATAQAPSNIAFIKYWGKKDENLRLPLNSSMSINLSGAYTRTTVDFDQKYTQDEIYIKDGAFSFEEKSRVIKSLQLIRDHVKTNKKAKVVTFNTFPKGTGAAASASGFAALTVASFASLGVELSEKELTIFSRIGSGSACRSIPDGFVFWKEGDTSEDSFAYSLYPAQYWDLRDALIIVDSTMKKVSTSDGQKTVQTSPLLSERLKKIPERIKKLNEALSQKNFFLLGSVIEEDCLDMHAVMQTQQPSLMYWNEDTVQLMKEIISWRSEGVPVYFTIDAGPNVHVIYEGRDETRVKHKIESSCYGKTVIWNSISDGTRIIEDHLF